ncbi:amine oxidase [Luteitalea sp. TBR-22]|uniref:NAD(P)/FAD-dependent oxidoreductase n=1 Tax=Luteitalea sp. TBR-22 TaxID=2802971 RepID=UPI001AF17265|nr:FAD-dependent oxidoreductase [Luteitalea sp. TBR-22]BCS34357.1 amine oxidase [Luteitalea sp. TBR-22]
MRIAVIGSGISGLGAAYVLSRQHHVTLFEREPRLGGHAHTHAIPGPGGLVPLDTGFLVFNERTYPNFIELLRQLGVGSHATDMCFGVRCRRCGLEYASQSISSLVAQRWRVLDPRHMRMLVEIVRYFRASRRLLQSAEGYDLTLGGFLHREGFSRHLTQHFVLPMGGAIWSASFADMMEAPARTILQFYENHGLLAASGAPPWRTVTGGSRAYVEAIAARVSGPIHVATPVQRIVRLPAGVEVETGMGTTERFDRVIIATHADTALALLADASPAEQEALGAFRYSTNRTILHTDASVLPRTRRAWASWNCDIHDCRDATAPVSLTYHLNRLQGVPGDTQYCVTLNPREQPRGEILAAMDYTHPVLDRSAVTAQARVEAINGERHTFFCGAHLRYGFHEDGLVSALRVTERFGARL